MSGRIETIVNLHCGLGEGPLWDPDRESLYWTDIPAGRIHQYSVRERTTATVYEGPLVSGFTREADGTLLLFRERDIARLYPDGRVKPVLAFPEDGADRFNDVIADPEGRVFAGRYAKKNEDGGLYRIDPDGSIHLLFKGCACPNGMGFSPDLKTFYYTCSTSRTIERFHYDRATGKLADRQLFYQATKEEGTPDGLTVDEEGVIWSARFGGASVIRHAPDGRVLETISFPASQITSVMFGGEMMNTLFVTSAGGSAGSESADGALFALQTEAKGRIEFRSRILLQ